MPDLSRAAGWLVAGRATREGRPCVLALVALPQPSPDRSPKQQLADTQKTRSDAGRLPSPSSCSQSLRPRVADPKHAGTAALFTLARARLASPPTHVPHCQQGEKAPRPPHSTFPSTTTPPTWSRPSRRSSAHRSTMSWDRSRYQASRSYPVASADTIMSTNGRPPPYATTAASHAADSPPSSAAPPLPPVEGSSSSSSSWSRRRERDDGLGSASASSSAGRRGDDPGWDAFRRNGSSTSASASTTTGLPPVSAPAQTSSATSLSLRRAEPSKLDRWDSGPSASGLPPPRPRASPPPPPAPPQVPKRFTTNNWGSATDSAVVEEKVVPRRFGPVPSGPAAGAGPPGGAWGRPNPGSFKSGGPGPAVSLGPQSFGPAPPTAPRGSRVFDSSVPLGPSRDRYVPLRAGWLLGFLLAGH